MRKVTPELEDRMRELRTRGMTYREIAEELGISAQTVCYHLNPEAAKRATERLKKWSTTHPEHHKETMRKWRAAHSEHHKEAMKEAMKEYYAKIRRAVINLLGGCCANCGITDHRVLQINHINGDARKDYEKYNGRQKFYKAIFCGKRPTNDLNLLCANCNILYDYDTGRRKYVSPEHLAVIKLLGGKCANCGSTDPRVLQVNHLKGGGSTERKANPKGFYRTILRGERPTDDLNLLCANCNILYEH